MSGRPLTRLALLSAAASIALALPVASAAGAALPGKRAGKLSPLLQRLSGPALRNASPARQAAALGVVASGPGSLLRVGDRVIVEARFDHGAIASRDEVHAAGAQVLDASRRNQTAALALDPAKLRDVAAVPTVASLRPVLTPLVRAVGCEGGSVISEGVSQLGVDRARESFALRGNGITVGILSDSFDAATEAAGGGAIATHAAEDVASNDLPGPASSCSDQQVPTDVLEDFSGGADEGRAMAQIVHDVAPHATLAFATAFGSEEGFAANIERLARPVAEGGAGADVIIDDVGYFEEPFFQDGPVAAAIDKVTAEGVTYLAAAGNDNLFDAEGHEIASWEAPEFRDAGECPAKVEALEGFNGTHCMDFNPSVAETDTTFGITVEAGETLIVDLQWAEAWGGVGTNLDAFLLDAAGTEILTKSIDINNGEHGTQRPYEIVGWENKSKSARTVQLAINRRSGSSDPRLKFIMLENGRGVSATEYPQSEGGDVVGPTVFGHAGAAAAIAVGAVRYDDSTKPESYSSRGPVTHYFGPVEGAAPAPALSEPEVLVKPDLVATDCGATTFFAARDGSGAWRFCGTSAAAPHAGAVAALLAQGKPGATPQEIRDAMTASALTVGSYGPDQVGAGLLDPEGALTSLGVEPGGEDGPSTVLPSPEPEPTPEPEPEPTPEPEPEPEIVPRLFAEQAEEVEVAPARPATWFRRHPRHRVRTARAPVRLVFRFASDQGGVAFLCRVDRGRLHRCPARLSRRFGVGRHVVRVTARNQAGLLDATPAVFRFHVQRVLRRLAGAHRRP